MEPFARPIRKSAGLNIESDCVFQVGARKVHQPELDSFWLLYLLDYNMSIAVWVGIIALAGLSAEMGVVMLLYLDGAFEDARQAEMIPTRTDLVGAVYNSAVKRVRPVVMLGTVITAGLLPIMRSHGTGTDVMKRIAAPMVGGVVTTVLVVYPAICYIWRARGLQTVLMAGVRKLREPGKEVSVSRLGVVES